MTWRPSLPGTTWPSGRPSSGRYSYVMWDMWHWHKSALMVLFWYTVCPPAGVCYSHGAAARHSSHCWSLLILVTTLLFSVLFLSLCLKCHSNEIFVSTVHLWGILFRLIRACTWPLSKWKHMQLMNSHYCVASLYYWHHFSLFGSLMFLATYIALSCCGELR